MWAEYKRGFEEILVYAKTFDEAQLIDLKSQLERNLTENIVNADAHYVKGVMAGIAQLKAQSKFKPEPIPKNSHIEKLIDQCNMLWKRNNV